MAETKFRAGWRKFWQLRPCDRALVLRAVYELAVARVRLASTPFQRLLERLNRQTGLPVTATLPEALADYPQRVGYAVSAAAGHVFWRSDCFPQAIAAHSLLARECIHSVIHLGVKRVGDDLLNGHAWLSCGNRIVVGEAEMHKYTEVRSIGR